MVFWPAGAPDPIHCEGCGYENERTDLSCILISLLALFPQLKRLEVCTKVIAWGAGVYTGLVSTSCGGIRMAGFIHACGARDSTAQAG